MKPWAIVATVVVFILALAGSCYAAYVLLPDFFKDPATRGQIRLFLIVLAATILVIVFRTRLRRK